MTQIVCVVTNVEMGWDCVCGVFNNYRDAVESCFHNDNRPFEEKEYDIDSGETMYVIHQKVIQ